MERTSAGSAGGQGVVSKIATPFEFQALEGRLKLLASGEALGDSRKAAGDAAIA